MITRRTVLGTLAAPLIPLSAAPTRFVGVTLMPEYIQNETVRGVVDRLQRAGVTAVATSPYVMAPANEKDGSREPPVDAGAGKVRLLDRPLWGKRELFVTTAPSFAPEEKLYRGLRYQPPAVQELTRKQGGILAEFIDAAQSSGMEVYFQIQAASPPGFRVQFGGPTDEDRPRLPDGRVPPKRLSNNGSLASEAVRQYQHALIRDLLRAYPKINGLRVDWPEYPPYLLDDVFLDFSDAARQASGRFGIPFDRMRQDAGRLYRHLHGGLSDRDLQLWLESDGGRFGMVGALRDNSGFADLLRLKALLVEELVAGFRTVITEAAGKDKKLLPNAFPPPFSLASGMDFQRAGRSSDGLSVKLYTMHWPMILRFYAEQLLAANRKLSEPVVVRSLARLFDMTDSEPSPRLADWTYPEPDVPHPAGVEAQARKIRQAQAEAGETPVYALAHGYGPVEDFRRRLEVAYKAAGKKVWINRYGYLSDAKLQVIREVCRA